MRYTKSRLSRKPQHRFRPQLEALENRLAPAILIVNSLADAPVNLSDDVVTLRDAIEAANNDLQVSPGGPTGSGADQIHFQSGLSGSIPLSQGELVISSDLTIAGPGANLLTVSGNNVSRVFNVDDGMPFTIRAVTLSGLTISDGNAGAANDGGGIWNAEGLTVQGCTLSGNSAERGGGIFNSLFLTVQNSMLSGNSATSGAGIFNDYQLTVRNSTLSGNTAQDDGGGIFNSNFIIVQNSTLSGNSATSGGGMFNSLFLTLENSTLSGNTAQDDGGGIFNTLDGRLTVQNCTLTQNHADNDDDNTGAGGGIFASSTATASLHVALHNTIVADNFRGAGITIHDDVNGTIENVTATLDPADPIRLFKREGNEAFTPGSVLTLTDATNADFIAFYATNDGARPGVEMEIVTTFQIQQTLTNLADTGNRVVINDGVTHAAIAAAIIKNGERGIGLLSQGAASDEASYPVFVPVDWQAAPVTLRLRRHANGDAEIMEVNGVAPSAPAVLTADLLPVPTRAGTSVEFGALSVEAQCTVEYSLFRAVTFSTNNLIGVDTGLSGISNGENGNQVGTVAAPLDPLLGPLADNGGPTLPHALLAGSPAIDAGDNARVPGDAFDLDGDENFSELLPFDQRGPGFRRFFGVAVDAGAFEAPGNAAPAAEANGPYAVTRDGAVVFSSSGSTDPDENIALYEWDFDYDGVSFDTDAIGATVIFSAAGVGPSTRTVALRVTDDLGAADVDTAALTILPLGSAAFAEFVDPHPAPGNQFGHTVLPLSTGNVVITSPFDDAGGSDAGAVYLFDGASGALISTLTGSSPYDHVGLAGVMALTNGNYLVSSLDWDNGAARNAGAVTFGSGTSGVSGTVSAANSLIGSSASDVVGSFGSITILPNGNYLVRSLLWDNGAAKDAGAVTFGSGASGISGTISAANSLVGASAGDRLGANVKVLPNASYLVIASGWDNGAAKDAGAVTFGSGFSGVRGTVSATNSLIGSTTNDRVGGGGVTVLKTGGTITDREGHVIIVLPTSNYVVSSPSWGSGKGAVTFGTGASGVLGIVGAANSLVGSQPGDLVGSGGVVALTNNGNYVVNSPSWGSGGAATFGNGTTGISGIVSAANSLVIGLSISPGLYPSPLYVTPLTNGNYVVSCPGYSLDPNDILTWWLGAVTFGSGTIGISGPVSAANSLIGSTVGDFVGAAGITAGVIGNGVRALPNGNYVVLSPDWRIDTSVGLGSTNAVTFANGTTGVTGPVSAANSLIGGFFGGVTALANGNVVLTGGAVMLTNGTTGVRGVVTASDVFFPAGSVESITELTNGNYVILSQRSVTFASGTSPISGSADSTNSLVGSKPDDFDDASVTPLANGNYLVRLPNWDNGAATDAGALTFASGTSGISGTVSAANSLVGSTADDEIGRSPGAVTALANGNYIVTSRSWDNGYSADAGAVTFANGTTGISGPIAAFNSLLGSAASSDLLNVVFDDVNDLFFARFLNDGSGHVRVGSQLDGIFIEVANGDPVAEANGPYSVAEGASVVLSSSGSSDPDNNIVLYEWDFDYDGVTFDVDAVASSPVFSAIGLDGPAMRTVALRVTDDLGLTDIDTASLTILNAPPTAVDDSAVTNEDQAASINVLANDSDPAGALDPLPIVSVTNGSKGTTAIDDKGTPDTTDNEIIYTPNPGATGSDSFTYTISDGDGGTATATVTVHIRNLVTCRVASSTTRTTTASMSQATATPASTA